MGDSQLAVQQQPSVPMMLQTMIERGVTADNAEAMTQLMALHERMQDREAERQFNAAFAKLQSELPVIVASSVIPNRGKYERFEDVMKQIQPHLTANGFSVSFSQSFTDVRIIETCHLSHSGGHSRPNSFGVRLGGKADSETQADCKAATTAKRNALLNALNIVIRQDCLTDEHDPTMSDDKTVTKEQAEEIRRLVKVGRFNEGDTLAWLDAKTFESIAANRYDDAVGYLKPKKSAPLDPMNAKGEFEWDGK